MQHLCEVFQKIRFFVLCFFFVTRILSGGVLVILLIYNK